MSSRLSSKIRILSLYKKMLRESEKFNSYNFRMFALRRVRDGFKEGKSLSDSQQIEEAIKFAEKNFDVIKRQVIIGNLYSTEKLVIEKISESN